MCGDVLRRVNHSRMRKFVSRALRTCMSCGMTKTKGVVARCNAAFNVSEKPCQPGLAHTCSSGSCFERCYASAVKSSKSCRCLMLVLFSISCFFFATQQKRRKKKKTHAQPVKVLYVTFRLILGGAPKNALSFRAFANEHAVSRNQHTTVSSSWSLFDKSNLGWSGVRE